MLMGLALEETGCVKGRAVGTGGKQDGVADLGAVVFAELSKPKKLG